MPDLATVNPIGEGAFVALLGGVFGNAPWGARARSLTADLAAEQGSAGLDRMTDADAAAFDRLNAAHRARFGVPFIIAVRARGRVEILSVFEARLGWDPAAGRATALDAVAQITRLRRDRLIDV